MRTDTRPARPAGFTLIELLIGITVSLLVFSATTEVLTNVNAARRIQQERSELDRDAALAMWWFRWDFSHAGAADATNKMDNTGIGVAGTSMSPPVRDFSGTTLDATNAPKQFALIAELPRPDTNFDGLMMVTGDSVSGPPFTDIPVVSEISGRNNQAAQTRAEGSVIPGSTCSSAGDPGCPWGLRKYGTSSNMNQVQVIVPNNFYVATTISGLLPTNSSIVNSPHGVTVSTGTYRPPNRPFSSGRLIQVDRVGYKFDSGTATLQRRQCWATPDFADANVTNMNSPQGCSGGNDTGWQVIARNVVLSGTRKSRFLYYNQSLPVAGAGTPFALPTNFMGLPTASGNVQSVGVELHLTKQANVSGSKKRVLNLDISEQFFIR